MNQVHLRSIAVRNVRSYESAQAEFPPGSTLLVGDVGAGKTSLLHAIEMALFGFAEIPAEHLIRHHSRDAEVTLGLEDEGHRYEFRRKMRRKTVRGKATFETVSSDYAVDGRRANYPPAELRQRAIDLLGFPDDPNPKAHSDVWRWAVYIPQERMREVLLQAPEERLETVRKALGIEQYRTAAENAAELATELRHRAALVVAQSSTLLDAERMLERASEEERALAARAETLHASEPLRREELVAADTALNAELRAVAQLEADRNRALRLREETRIADEDRAVRSERARTARQRAVELRTEADRAEAEALALGQRIRPREQAETALDALRLRRGELEVAAREHAGLEAKLGATMHREEELSADSARVAGELAEAVALAEGAQGESGERPGNPPSEQTAEQLELETRRLRIAVSEALVELSRREQALRELEELLRQGTCPRCHQPVRPETFAEHAAAARSETEVARSRHLQLALELDGAEQRHDRRVRYDAARAAWELGDRRLSELREAVRRLGIRSDELRTAREAIAASRRGIETGLAGLAGALAERQSLESESRALDEEIEEIDRAAALQEKRRERARTDRTRATETDREAELHEADAQKLARSLESSRTELLELEERILTSGGPDDRLRELTGIRDGARTALESLVGELREVTRAGAEASSRRSEAEDRLERRRSLEARAAELQTLAGWIRGAFRTGLLELERRRLSSALEQFNEALSRNFANLLDDPGLLARCDPYFTPLVELEGEPTPAEALSGGERTALALAFRLAMGEIVRAAGRLRLDTLVLDEPTDGFSPEQVLRLGELLGKLPVGQLLLVTHERQLESFVDHVIQVEKLDGRSRLVVGSGARTVESGATGVQEPLEPPPSQ